MQKSFFIAHCSLTAMFSGCVERRVRSDPLIAAFSQLKNWKPNGQSFKEKTEN